MKKINDLQKQLQMPIGKYIHSQQNPFICQLQDNVFLLAQFRRG